MKKTKVSSVLNVSTAQIHQLHYLLSTLVELLTKPSRKTEKQLNFYIQERLDKKERLNLRKTISVLLTDLRSKIDEEKMWEVIDECKSFKESDLPVSLTQLFSDIDKVVSTLTTESHQRPKLGGRPSPPRKGGGRI